MDRKLILTLIVSFLFVHTAFGQLLKVRVGANGSTFQKEVGSPEMEFPGIDVLYPADYVYTDFSSNLEVGFEGEVMLLWTPHIETGLEFEYAKMTGSNDFPKYYNYILSLNYDAGTFNAPPLNSLFYETSAISTAINARYYLLPKESINPFLKVFGGISLVGTDFNYEDPNDRITYGEGIGFSMGTENSDEPREPALYFGAGAGVNFTLSNRISLYIDGNASFIKSDKVDGIPNFNYEEVDGQPHLAAVGNNSFFTQISIGLVFDTGIDLGWVKSEKRGTSVKRTGRTSENFPFFRQKALRFH